MGSGTLKGRTKWGGLSRTARKIFNNLGIIPGEDAGGINQVRKWRSDDLDLYDQYYDSTQYAKLAPWDEHESRDNEYIPIRKRKPRIVFNFAKVLVDRVAAKLVGDNVFPDLKIEDNPEDNEFIRAVLKLSKLKHGCMDPVKKMLLSGSSLMRFYMIDGTFKIEGFKSKYCYPQFQANGELEAVRVRYTYMDEQDKDAHGKPKEKWYQLDLGMNSDILYDNPEYQKNTEPQFQVVSEAAHSFGFVQAEWLRTREDLHDPDGDSLIADVMDFIDELNYSLSQSSQAVAYGQEPQLALSEMDEEDIAGLIKSSAKAWNLGKKGKAEFIEANLGGVEQANDLRDKVRLGIQDIARVVLMDPEKMVASAQSGRALEVLHGPLVELVNELRPQIEKALVNALTKMALVILEMTDAGMETSLEMPAGYKPKSLDIATHWPPIFPMTLQDLQIKATIASTLTAGNVFSREWATRWLAHDVGVEDIEAELTKIAAQPILNPFGGGFGG